MCITLIFTQKSINDTFWFISAWFTAAQQSAGNWIMFIHVIWKLYYLPKSMISTEVTRNFINRIADISLDMWKKIAKLSHKISSAQKMCVRCSWTNKTSRTKKDIWNNLVWIGKHVFEKCIVDCENFAGGTSTSMPEYNATIATSEFCTF